MFGECSWWTCCLVVLSWLPALGHWEDADGPRSLAQMQILSKGVMSISGLQGFIQFVYEGLESFNLSVLSRQTSQ